MNITLLAAGLTKAFPQILGSLSAILGKAKAHCRAKNIQPDALLGARLFPDMLPLNRQVQLACDFATKGCARGSPTRRRTASRITFLAATLVIHAVTWRIFRCALRLTYRALVLHPVPGAEFGCARPCIGL